MVLLVLAVVWGVLLISWFRSRTQGGFSDSVGTFRRHLSVLERAAPARVAPANRLHAGVIAGRSVPAYRSAALPASGRGPAYPSGPPRLGSRPGAALRPPTATTRRRRQLQKRRRDVFFALLAGVLASLVLAFIPGLSVMWSVQIIFDLALLGYVALLIRMRNLAAERELKLRFMPSHPNARVPEAQPAYDMGGYGDIELAARRQLGRRGRSQGRSVRCGPEPAAADTERRSARPARTRRPDGRRQARTGIGERGPGSGVGCVPAHDPRRR